MDFLDCLKLGDLALSLLCLSVPLAPNFGQGHPTLGCRPSLGGLKNPIELPSSIVIKSFSDILELEPFVSHHMLDARVEANLMDTYDVRPRRLYSGSRALGLELLLPSSLPPCEAWARAASPPSLFSHSLPFPRRVTDH